MGQSFHLSSAPLAAALKLSMEILLLLFQTARLTVKTKAVAKFNKSRPLWSVGPDEVERGSCPAVSQGCGQKREIILMDCRL